MSLNVPTFNVYIRMSWSTKLNAFFSLVHSIWKDSINVVDNIDSRSLKLFLSKTVLSRKADMFIKWSLKQWGGGTTDIQSCPIKLPPLFRAPAVWVVPVWLIHRLMWEWCHLYAILIELLQQKYFQYISIICSCCC